MPLAFSTRLTVHPTAKVYEEVYRKLPAGNTTVQPFTLYTDRDGHSA